MAEILGYLIQKDGSGWKMAGYTEYDGSVFTLENGEMVGKYQGFVAEANNIIAMVQNVKMRTMDELWMPAFDADQIMKALKKVGYCLDHQWRVRRFLREPFTKLTVGHIMPLIEIHKQYCESKSRSPEAYPITLGWFEEKLGLMFSEQEGNEIKVGIAQLPTHEGGQFGFYVDRLENRRFTLKFGDWYAVPCEQNEAAPVCTLKLIQYLKDFQPLEGDSVEAILGKDQFISPEGILVGKGSYFNISIDDFLKGA